MSMINAKSIMTVVSLITFIGIIWWAYSNKRRAEFMEAERIPFADDSNE